MYAIDTVHSKFVNFQAAYYTVSLWEVIILLHFYKIIS